MTAVTWMSADAQHTHTGCTAWQLWHGCLLMHSTHTLAAMHDSCDMDVCWCTAHTHWLHCMTAVTWMSADAQHTHTGCNAWQLWHGSTYWILCLIINYNKKYFITAWRQEIWSTMCTQTHRCVHKYHVSPAVRSILATPPYMTNMSHCQINLCASFCLSVNVSYIAYSVSRNSREIPVKWNNHDGCSL